MDSKDILEELKCPICFEIPEDKIFLCENGHPICDTCSSSLQICPQCRASFGNVKVRNRTLEVLLDSMKFECTNINLGCEEKVGRKALKSHSTNCPFSANNIKLCKEIGFKDCGFASNLVDISTALEHYRKKHGFIFRDDLHFQINLPNFDKTISKANKKPVDSFWTPLLINHCHHLSNTSANLKPSKILLLTFYHGKEKSVSWMCVRLSSDKKGQVYHVQFEIMSLSEKASDLSWRIPVTDADKIETMIPNSPFRIPKELLAQHYTKKDGTLSVTVKLVPLKGKRVDVVLHSMPSILNQICPHNQPEQSHAPVEASASSQVIPPDGPVNPSASQVTFPGVKCEGCGVLPIKDVRYFRLRGNPYNLCKNCVKADSRLGQWFAIIRKPAQKDENVYKMWTTLAVRNLRFYGIECTTSYTTIKDFPTEMLSNLHFPRRCAIVDCQRPAVATCLHCYSAMMVSFCDMCIENRCLNHVCVLFTQRPGSISLNEIHM